MALCQKAVQYVLQLTLYKLQKLNGQIGRGLLQPERPLTETQIQRDQQATISADTVLAWLHANVAEDLAEGVRVSSEGAGSSSSRSSRNNPLPKLTTVAFLDFMEENEQDVRWMPPGTTLAEMHELAISFLPHMKVSYSTFVKCYHLTWRRRLKIRAEGQHGKCSICEG